MGINPELLKLAKWRLDNGVMEKAAIVPAGDPAAGGAPPGGDPMAGGGMPMPPGGPQMPPGIPGGGQIPPGLLGPR